MRSDQKYLKGITPGMDTGQLSSSMGWTRREGEGEAAGRMSIQAIYRLPSKSWLEGWLAS